MNYFEGVLISGSTDYKLSSSKSVELFDLKKRKSCELPNLPQKTKQHTSVGGVICGGGYTRTSCVDINSGSWSSDKYQPIRPRYGHVSWNISPGESFMVLGGYNGSRNTLTTDIVYTNGTVVPGFELKYFAL